MGQAQIEVMELSQTQLEFCVTGSTPLIIRKLSEKARAELLLGGQKKTAAERASSIKHDPLQEYRDSPYTLREFAYAYLAMPAAAFKAAMATAALDQPGARKTQIGRLVHVVGDEQNLVAIYGAPKLFMSIVRSADINRTPDIRTRAILPEWACRLRVRYVTERFQPGPLSRLLAAAGLTAGIGDWRPEKGKGSYGQFRLAGEDDEDFARIIATGGREAQIAALENPEPYDMETEELLGWYQTEVNRRGLSRNGSRPEKAEVIA